MYFIKKYKHGFFNAYRVGMPVTERFTKDVSYLILAVRHWAGNGGKHKTIYTYPEYPNRKTSLYKLAKQLGYNISNKPKKNIKSIIYWQNVTFRKPLQSEQFPFFNGKIANDQILDISKLYVDEVFLKVFGYCTKVDPLTFGGKMVQKSDLNATHDGLVVQGPLNEKADDTIYQILIDNTVGENLVQDIRLPYTGGLPDFVYLKNRDIGERFLNTTVDTTVHPIAEILSHEEMDLINEFCVALSLDFGELDILRDKNSGKIYIVDVNNTPHGPPANTEKTAGKLAISKIGKAYLRHFCEG